MKVDLSSIVEQPIVNRHEIKVAWLLLHVWVIKLHNIMNIPDSWQ